MLLLLLLLLLPIGTLLLLLRRARNDSTTLILPLWTPPLPTFPVQFDFVSYILSPELQIIVCKDTRDTFDGTEHNTVHLQLENSGLKSSTQSATIVLTPNEALRLSTFCLTKNWLRTGAYDGSFSGH